jgi:threonine/homoserine/homoserine lactone efflux protein
LRLTRNVGAVPSLSTLPVFIAASIVLLVIPGPAVLFIVARSGSQGRRAGLVSVLGVHTASIVHVLAAVAGLSAVVVASSIAFTAVKVVGGFYLIVLGVKSLRSARRSADVVAPTVRPEKRLFAEAFLVSLLNPKVALFFLAFLPQFVQRGHGPIWTQTLVLGAIYILLGLCSDSVYATIGARLGTRLSGRAAQLRATRYAEGGILVGLGVLTLALPHRRAGK